MMATISKGYAFGATELVTNTKLSTLVDSATISGIVNSELSNNILTSMASASGKVPPQNLFNFNSAVATNASVPNVGSYTSLKLYYSTYGSIASFANMRVGQEFTLIAGQASFPSIIDTGNFLMNGNWVPAKANDSIRFLWDGTNFIEISRISV